MLTSSCPLRFDQALSVFCITVVCLLSSVQFVFVARAHQSEVVRARQVWLSPVAVHTSTLDITLAPTYPEISARAALVIDANSGAVLFEHNAAEQLLPASATKIMTALVARDLWELEHEVVIDAIPNVVGASIGFIVGERVSMQTLLQAALMQSGNEAALLIAAQHPGGVDGFVAAMNEAAQTAGLSDTFFANPIGFDAPNHYSSAQDLAQMSMLLLQDPVLADIVATPVATITDVLGTNQRTIWNTHRLVHSDSRFIGVKTGTTTGASEVLVSAARLPETTVLVLVLGSTNRYTDTLSLIQWVEDQYTWVAVSEYLR